ncbi:hypothetical protein SKAU_G00367410 [Synaphobranchus kaupii]|uniref:Uncharacterized protein n=1 Tax=Synaphobranchus kaupii TaxID=118154 RepID=A0A9Q1EFH0_SYNKA|nr:hypothetical protein SKAU_G00367410 [Synaphobranchus kaupii]
MSGMANLLPSASAQSAPVHAQAMGNRLGSELSFDSPQTRIVRRAPKLGQIGRSKKVVIEDDVDDILNNNGQFAVFLNLAPVA